MTDSRSSCTEVLAKIEKACQHVCAMSYSGRWRVAPINPDEAPRLQFSAHYTLREAKREIDRAWGRP